MPLAFILDENLRGPLWRYVERHNTLGVNPLDVVRVRDLADLPLGSDDSDIIRWAEREGRILVSSDERTLAGHLAAHLGAGRYCPGILVRRAVPFPLVVKFLVLVAYA